MGLHTGGGTICSSAGDGTCVQCNAASTCPGVDNDCQTRTCGGGHTCGFSYMNGTPRRQGGSCHTKHCAGAGGVDGISNDIDDNDKPVNGKECTDDVCLSGVPSNPPLPIGMLCSIGLCNATGDCAPQCVTPRRVPASATSARPRPA